ncbi:urease accessory protein UreE [Caldalkalibacillus uzonensis]|uniref:Urease accessory protein UreE n=1 Tax=Caldalkalibacillus uzonensis TaxID=353224 RepID=A0ABU0CQZ1_9BACI|nr:urease accessory protein UreE [Caldalkalibacillus uzonensis]
MQIVVETQKEEAYIIYPANMQAMGKVAFELGNRHTPALIEENRIVVRYDYTLELLFQEAGVHYEHTFYRFPEPFRYRGHHHAYHTHSTASSAHS